MEREYAIYILGAVAVIGLLIWAQYYIIKTAVRDAIISAEEMPRRSQMNDYEALEYDYKKGKITHEQYTQKRKDLYGDK